MQREYSLARLAGRWIRSLALAAVAGSALGVAQAASDQPLKLGSTAAFMPVLEVAAAEAAKQGVAVELVEFSDWKTPNVTLAQGDIDANYYQHIPFLTNANKEGGFDLKPVAPGVINNIGLYSKKYRSLDELPVGAKVAIAGDAVNGARGLQLLEKAGLIKLKPGTGFETTVADIVENPKQIRIIELEAVQLARALDDVDLAQGMPHYLKLAGTIDPESALIFDGQDRKIYAIQFVTRPEGQNDERLRQFIKVYQSSPVVRAALDRTQGKLYTPGWEE